MNTRIGLFVLTGTLAVSSCDRSPTSPPVRPDAAPTLTRVSVSGPPVIAPGETGHYIATAHYSDQSSRDVTTSAVWTVANPSLTALTFVSAGEALAVRPGESPIRALFESSWGGFPVLVLYAGTFKLSGVVSDSGGGLLPDVTVEVVTGIGQGLRTTTGAQGQYALYGVAGSLQLRALAEGFTPQVREVIVAGNDGNGSFALVPAGVPADISGIWTMTVAPAAECRSGLPPAAQGRSYRAQIAQRGTRVEAAITSPTISTRSYPNPGSVFGSQLRLVFPGDTGYDGWSTPGFYDQLSSTEQFGFSGFVDGTVSGNQIRATLNGDLVYWNARTFEPTWYCRSIEHVVILQR